MTDDIDMEDHDMKDDIDIEEHDVLDNPRIRTIFPDLAQINEEISGDYHGVIQPAPITTGPDSRMEHQPYSRSEDSRQHDQDDTSENARFGNRISKPSSTLRISEDIQNEGLVFGISVEIKRETEENEETTEKVHHPENVHKEKNDSVSTVLILGTSSSGVIEPITINDFSHDENKLGESNTKFIDQETDPNCKDNDTVHDIDTNDPKDSKAALVLLENWGPRLENSSCYCKECLILFPTSNTLLAHNMAAHSLPVAEDKNKAVKSTAKTNVHKVSNDSGKFCNDCNKMFPDSESHIDHLYEKIAFDKNNAVFKPQPKQVVSNSCNKTVLPKQLEDDAEFGSEMQVYDQEAVELFQCQVCSIYLELYGNLVKHMINHHSITEFSQEKVLFTGTCLLCSFKAKNQLNYNKHIMRFHPEVNKYKGPLPQSQLPKKLVATNKPIPMVAPQTRSQVIQCQICNATFRYYSQARRHREIKHPESCEKIFKTMSIKYAVYQCDKCKSCFNNDNNVKKHYAECESIQPDKKCDHCLLMFLSNRSLNMHLNRHHGSDNFKFHVISVNYDEKSARSRVVKTVSSKKTLDKDDDTLESKNKNTIKLSKLQQCGKRKAWFNSNKVIKQHYEECESILPNKKSKKHVEISEIKNTNANKYKIYQCGKCKICFNARMCIKRHECESIKPEKKCDKCQLMFPSNASLIMHINRHHRSNSYNFHVILANYGEKTVMTRVVKTVSSKKPLDEDDDTSESKNTEKLSTLYQCGKCKSCLNCNKNFKQHYVECEGIQPNQKCDQCQLMFFSKIALTKHINRYHRSDNYKFYVILVNYVKKPKISWFVKTVSSKTPGDKKMKTRQKVTTKKVNKLLVLNKNKLNKTD